MKLEKDTLVSHYKILSPIGKGGMGEVYLAQDTRLDRQIALKILPAEFAEDADRMNRFVREAKSASALNHPNIITIYEIGEREKTHYIATEFIDGKTLNDYAKDNPLNLKSALDIAIQVVSALDEAHQAGIVHRDIKPDNIMIRPNGLVKILDFGIAKFSEKHSVEIDSEDATAIQQPSTSPGMIIGTANYMSPEQAKGQTVDARTDIFSFGVMLYEMLSRQLPFSGDTAMETISAIIKDEPKPLNDSDVPPEIERIISKALRKNADERYQTIKGLLADLREVKQELEFQDKLEKTIQPDRAEPKTQMLKATTIDDLKQPVTTENPGDRLTIKKSSFGKLAIAVFAALLISAIGLGYWFYSKSNSKQIDSIAVLPFENTSGDSDVEYLSDGIAESLINSLTEIQQLKVIARSTAFQFKGKTIDPQKIGRDLNVQAVLTGRVSQIGDRLDIQVDLVDTENGRQLWGEEFERAATDALSIKQAIAREVSEKLKLKLSGEEQNLIQQETQNPEAYRAYLRGRYYWNKRNAEGYEKAIAEFQQAIDKDPTYALGYVGLADCYLLMAAESNSQEMTTSEKLSRAKAAAEKALQIDDSLAEAHTSLGMVYESEWHWAEAEAEFKKAIALNPNYPTAHHWYSRHLKIKGQLDDSLLEIKKAQELDPLSPIINSSIVKGYTLVNDLDTAIELNQKALELNPNFPYAHLYRAWIFFKRGQNEEALPEFQKAVELSGGESEKKSILGYFYGKTGKRDQAVQILDDLKKRYAKSDTLGMEIATVYLGLGNKDKAFEWLEKDFENRVVILPKIIFDEYFIDIRTDPRYVDLVRRMGLEPL